MENDEASNLVMFAMPDLPASAALHASAFVFRSQRYRGPNLNALARHVDHSLRLERILCLEVEEQASLHRILMIAATR